MRTISHLHLRTRSVHGPPPPARPECGGPLCRSCRKDRPAAPGSVRDIRLCSTIFYLFRVLMYMCAPMKDMFNVKKIK